MTSSFKISCGKFKLISNGSTIAVLGPRNTGKTTVIRTILYYLNHKIRMPILISNTAHTTGDFVDIIPESLSFQKYDPSTMKSIMRSQVKFCNKLGENKRKNPSIKTYMAIVMDDVFAQSKKFKNDETFIEIFTEGRQSNITIITAFHDVLGIPTKVRGQIDYLLITREHRKQRIQALFDNYWPFKTSFEDFKEILSTCTQNYYCLFIDLKNSNRPGYNIKNSVYFLMPPSPKKLPKIKIGLKSIWNEHYKVIDPRWRDKKWLESSSSSKKNKRVILQKRKRNQKNKRRIIIFND
jgi:hypothetical protein